MSKKKCVVASDSIKSEIKENIVSEALITMFNW